MLNNDSKSPCAVLYVDDEEKALKYFRMAYSPKFEVFTATSGAEGLEILQRERAKIGIVISDQRMPEMQGAEFLGQVRNLTPNVVRILTTAYSDLDSAIQAVNRGHIYQYVVKPWEIPELGMVLQRAADYHQVLVERDQLLSLKMSTLQRVICSDRLKWLLLHSESMGDAGGAAFRQALAAMIKAMPDDLQAASAAGAFNVRQFEITQLILAEYRNASKCKAWLATGADAGAVSIAGDASGLDDVASRAAAFLALVAPGGAEISAVEGRAVTISIAEAGSSSASILGEMFGLLTEREVPEASVRLLLLVAAVAAAGGTLALRFAGRGETGGPLEVAFSPVGESAEAEQVIRELYERFSASDIARI